MPATTTKPLPKFSKLGSLLPPKINRDIYDFVKFFTEEERFLVAALVQNPFGVTAQEVGEKYGESVQAVLASLNRLHAREESVFETNGLERHALLLYLATVKFWFHHRGRYAEIKKVLVQENINYASRLLEKMDVKEIRAGLEDKFFAFLNPEMYAKYRAQLSQTRKKYLASRNEIITNFKTLLENNGIQAEIQERLKTIASIHKKITKKNILVSQVLDTIGLRIIVEQNDECYRSMWLILKSYPIMTNRIKDYISIPKSNGYQSIHLTILHGGHPVEIQIRTREMHAYSQFGKAGHLRYKKYGR